MAITVTGWLQDFRPLVRCRLTPAGDSYEPPAGIELVGLVDTGATDCHIRPATLAALGLPITERTHTSNVGTAGIKPATRINLTMMGVNQAGQPQAWAAVNARAFIDEFDPVADMIVGMNVLSLLSELCVRSGVPVLIAPN